MPNFKVDVDYDLDFLNVTFTRSHGVPKVTPAWKVRTAPKLGPPKSKALPEKSSFRPPSRPKINAARFQQPSSELTPRITDVTETEENSKSEGDNSSATNKALKPTSGNPKKNPPKLKDIGDSKAKATPNAANTSKAVNGVSKPQVNGTQ